MMMSRMLRMGREVLYANESASFQHSCSALPHLFNQEPPSAFPKHVSHQTSLLLVDPNPNLGMCREEE